MLIRGLMIGVAVLSLAACDNGGKRGGPQKNTGTFAPRPTETPPPVETEDTRFCQSYRGLYVPATTEDSDLRSLTFADEKGKTKVTMAFTDGTVAEPVIGDDPMDLPDGSTVAAGCQQNVVSLSFVSFDKELYVRVRKTESHDISIDLLDGVGAVIKQIKFIMGQRPI